MKIKAEVVGHAVDPRGNEIMSVLVTFPRFILAELNTHRMLSKNSASSRAIPFKRMVQSVLDNPFIPIAWQKDHSGMQGTEYITDTKNYVQAWLDARNDAIKHAERLHYSKVTKQLCNRLLEPFMWHTVLITATEWENFFALRCPEYTFANGISKTHVFRSRKDAIKAMPDLNHFGIHTQPLSDLDWLVVNKGAADIHMMALAEAIWDAKNESTPQILKEGEWYYPFSEKIDDMNKSNDLLATNWGIGTIKIKANMGLIDVKDLIAIKAATALAARTSYTVVGEDGKEMNLEQLVKLHDEKLLPKDGQPGHWSPFEHSARVMSIEEFFQANRIKGSSGWSGNFKGFIQYRKMFNNENITL